MIRLIVHTSKDDRCFKSNGHLDTSYRVFEVENAAFEELIKAGGSLTLIGLEVTDETFELPLPAAPPLPLAASAPTPALPAVGATGRDGVPASGPPSLPATRASAKTSTPPFRRYGRLNWRKWCRLPPYPSPTVASLPAVIKLPG